MKVWITKYALTQGIIEAEAKVTTEFSTMIQIIDTNPQTFYHKPYWHVTKERAIEHAEKMRHKKIESLITQIQKLRVMTF